GGGEPEVWGRWLRPRSMVTDSSPGRTAPAPLGSGLLGYIEPYLRRVLADRGFSFDEVLPVWRSRGWIEASQDGGGRRRKYRMMINDQLVWAIAIRAQEAERPAGRAAIDSSDTPGTVPPDSH